MIQEAITQLKDHILTCTNIQFLCGFDNVKSLSDKVTVIDIGNGEYLPLTFDDTLGNYFWIETNADVRFRTAKKLKISDCDMGYELMQNLAIFAVVKGANEVKLFECLLKCLMNYGCDITVLGGNYNSFEVVGQKLGQYLADEHIQIVLSRLSGFAVVRIDVTMVLDFYPTSLDCECVIC